MAILNDSEIAAAVIAAGFPKEQQATAVAVALAESGGNATARNNNSNGSTDYGLFQINSVHSQLLKTGNPDNPVDNAKMAFSIWQKSGWQPWVAWKRGKHIPFLIRARAAIGNPTATPIANDNKEQGGIIGFAKLIVDPATWMRLSGFIIGSTLIIIALLRITGTDKVLWEGIKLAATKGKM